MSSVEHSGKLKEWAIDKYYHLAQTTALRHVHQQLRIRHHRWRYGIKSAFMFRAVELEINSMCNRKCGYCPNITDKRPPAYMDQKLFEKIIDELGSIGFEGRISYHFYGEPLLDKRLPSFVHYTKKRVPNSRTEIYSNGDFLTLEMFRDYLRLGLDNFLITQHDNRMPPNLQRILDSASDDEKEHIAIRFARDRFMINRSGLIKTLTVLNEPMKYPCDWPLTSIVITATGNVVLCCNDYYETNVLGNAATQSLADIWMSPRFEQVRRALSNGDRTISPLCEKCDHVPDAARRKRIVPS